MVKHWSLRLIVREVVESPVPADTPRLHLESVPRFELPHGAEHREGSRRPDQSDVRVDRQRIEGAVDTFLLEKRLDLAREEETSPGFRIVERLDAHTVAREEERRVL
jgi:hypothetical protein